MIILKQPVRRSLFLSTTLAGIVLASGAAAQDLPELPNIVDQSVPGAVTPGDYDNSTPAATFDLGTSQRTVIEWETFNISNGFSLEFLYTGAGNGAVLNRVVGVTNVGSQINGDLIGPNNLAIYLLNSQGIVFGPNADVNVGSLIASTIDLPGPADYTSFMAGAGLNLAGGTTPLTVNGGASLSTSNTAGILALLGAAVAVNGSTTVTAAGDLYIVAAQDVFIGEAGSPLAIQINAGTTLNNPIIVGGTVQGRNVTMAFATQGAMTNALLSIDGSVSATGVAVSDGIVSLIAGDAAGPSVIVGGASDEESIVLNGAVSGQTVALSAGSFSGTVSQSAAGVITADSLTGTAGGSVDLSTALNQIAELDDFTSEGFALQNSGTLTLTGLVDGGAGIVSLATTGDLTITAPSGSVTTTSDAVLTSGGTMTIGTLSIGDDLTLTAADFAGAALSNPGAGGDLTITDTAGDLTLVAPLSAVDALSVTAQAGNLSINAAIGGTSVNLAASGTIGQSAAGIITTTTLTGSSGGTTDLSTVDNVVANLGAFTANGLALDTAGALAVTDAVTGGGGGVALDVLGPLSITAAVSGTTVDLVSTAGITQTSTGIVTATTLTGSSTNATDLTTADNLVTNLGAFSTGSGFALDDLGGLTVTGTVLGGTGNIALDTAGALAINAALTGVGVDLDADTTITQTAAGIITATTLTGSSGGSTSLTTADNVITNLGAFTADGFSLIDVDGLTVTGAVDGLTGTVTLYTSGTLTVDAPITGSRIGLIANSLAGGIPGADRDVLLNAAVTANSGVVGIRAGDSISQTAAGLITADTLNIIAGGSADLSILPNNVQRTGSVSAGSFSLNVSDSLSIGGASDLTIPGDPGDAAPGGDNDLRFEVGIPPDSPGVRAPDFNFSVGGALTVDGPLNGTNGRLSAGTSIMLNAPVTTSNRLRLIAGTSIDQSSAGIIDALFLTGSSGTATELASALNRVTNLEAFAATGFSLRDADGLMVVDAVNGRTGAIRLTTTGDLMITTGTLQTTGPADPADTLTNGGGDATLKSTGTITINNALSIADDLTMSAVDFAGVALTGPGAGDDITIVDTSGGLTLAAPLTAVGTLSVTTLGGGALTVTGDLASTNERIAVQTVGGGEIQLDGDLTATNATSGAVSLISSGAIGQSVPSVISTVTLSGSSVGATTLGSANAITNLGPFAAGGGLTLNDIGGLTIVGAVDGGPLVNITTSGALTVNAGIGAVAVDLDAGSIAINAGVTGTTSVNLDAGGAITQNASGVVTAGTLTGSSGTSTSLASAPNAVTTLGQFTTGTGFALTDVGGLTVVGPIAGGSGNVGIDTGGTVFAPGGVLALTGTITGANVALTGVGVTQTAAATVTASNGSITVDANDGAATFNGLLAANAVASGNVTIRDAAAVQLNTVAAGSTITLGLAGTDAIGSVTQPATVGVAPLTGAITGTTLVGNSTGTVTLTNPTNAISDLGPFTASNGLTLADVGGLTVIGSISGGPLADITTTGALTVNAGIGAATVNLGGSSIDINAGVSGTTSVNLGTGGAIAQSANGIVSAGTLTGSSGTTTNLATALNEITNLGAFSTGSGFALRDAGGLTVTGAVTGGTGNTSIDTTGFLTLNATVRGANVLLTSIGVLQNAAATVTATSGAITIDANDGDATFNGLLDASAITGGNVTIRDARDVQLGTIAAGATGTITLGATAAGDDVANVTQIGPMSGGTLTGVSRGRVTLGNAANALTNLGAFTAANGFELRDTGALIVTGAVDAGTSTAAPIGLAKITVDTLLTVNAAISGVGVELNSTGLTTGAAAPLDARSGKIKIDAGNAAVTLGAAIASTNAGFDAIAIIDAANVSLHNVSAAAGGLVLGTTTLPVSGTTNAPITGNVTQVAGTTVIANRLTGRVNGSVTLTNLTNSVNFIDGFGANGFALTDIVDPLGLTVTATLEAGAGPLTDAGTGALTLRSTRIDFSGQDLRADGLVNLEGGATLVGSGVLSRNSTIIGRAGSIDIGSASAAIDIDLAAGTSTRLGSGSAGRDIAILASNGTLTAGTLAAADDIVLRASAGALAVTVSATTGGTAALDSDGAADTLAGATQVGNDLDARGTSVDVAVANVASTVTTALAQNSDLRLTATSGQLTLGTGNVGGAATLIKQGGTTGNLTVTTGLTTRRANGSGAIAIDSATSANLSIVDTNHRAEGVAFIATGAANAGTAVTITANDLVLNGLVRGASVRLINDPTVANTTRLGDGLAAASGTVSPFALSQAEVNNVTAATLAIESGAQNVETGNLAFDADAGGSRINLFTTGRVDGSGAVTATGARTLQIGGSSDPANANSPSTLASVIRFEATANAGGRIALGAGATLDLRGVHIGFGLATGFLTSLGLDAGGTPLAASSVASEWVAQPGSTLYGVTTYTSPTLVEVPTLRITYRNYALFQNTASIGSQDPSGVLVNSLQVAGQSVGLGSSGDGADNAFALFGRINDRPGPSAALLGPTIVGINGVNRGNTRINGCLIQSGGGGCLITTLSQPRINVFESTQSDLLNPGDDFVVSLDPLIGSSNEALFGSSDAAPPPPECEPGSTDPACRADQGVRP